MDIYKLSDDVPVEPVRRGRRKGAGVSEVADDVDDGGVLKITDLKQGVRNENRVNVYINGKYSFSLDVAQVVDLGVKVGLEITEERLAELKKASEFGKLYQRTLEWVLIRPRSEREVRDYLRKKLRASSSETLAPARRYGGRCAPFAPVVAKASSEEPSEFLERIINRLTKRGYIDDKKFAEYYVENRFVKKGISERRLRMELMKKGVARGIIEEVMVGSARNDEEEIKKIIAKKRARYDDEKLIMYLVRQGFSFELAKSLVLEFGKD